MNRSTWTAVLVTVLVLVAATCSTYLPWVRLAAPVTVAATHAASPLADWIAERQFVLAAAGAGVPPGAVFAAASSVIALAAAAGAVVVALRALYGRRRRRPIVLELAKRGGSITDIARRTGMSQDAVRLLLSPRGRREAAPARTAPPAARGLRSREGSLRSWAAPAQATGTDFRDDPAAFAAALRRAARGGPASR